MTPTEETPVRKRSLLFVRSVINCQAMESKPTNECFRGPLWEPRIYDLCSTFRLPVYQPRTEDCVIAVLAPERGARFTEWFADVLSIDPEDDTYITAVELRRRGYCMSLPQAEPIVYVTEQNAERTGLRRDGQKNFFLVETSDPDSPIKVGHVCRDGQWDFHVNDLRWSTPWPPESRLLVRIKDYRKFERRPGVPLGY